MPEEPVSRRSRISRFIIRDTLPMSDGAYAATRRRLFWAVLLIALLLSVTGGVFLGVFLTEYHRAKQTVLWPSTNGHVEWSRITSYRYGRSHQHEGYHLRIGYAYRVDGKPYHRDRYSISHKYQAFHSAQPAEDQLKQYPAGASIKVFFNPLQPGESLLHLGPPEDLGGDMITPIILTGALTLVAATASFLLITMRLRGSSLFARKR
ncbi:MAG: DUF3592 domain-containing protein [Deltaproteobacteria bacterium]|nr:DUF3592 domain-containing protein [Deltaproteobacteria bacterium]